MAEQGPITPFLNKTGCKIVFKDGEEVATMSRATIISFDDKNVTAERIDIGSNGIRVKTTRCVSRLYSGFGIELKEAI